MSDLNSNIQNMKQKYRDIFLKSVDAIQGRVNEIKPESVEGDIFDCYAENSYGRQWQNAVLEMFDKDICHEIYRKWQEVLDYRKEFHCKGCATCCNLACSEFSPEELKQKAKNGDNFATQFTKIFIPYASKSEAKEIYPEYIDLLDEMKEDDVYFYHCPKLTDCKRCSDYENRPNICKDFPDNPLSILPKSCGFYEWRKEVEPMALMLHAMLEIIEYYKEKISVSTIQNSDNKSGDE
jgi:Fe-S-cluster containining protein